MTLQFLYKKNRKINIYKRLMNIFKKDGPVAYDFAKSSWLGKIDHPHYLLGYRYGARIQWFSGILSFHMWWGLKCICSKTFKIKQCQNTG